MSLGRLNYLCNESFLSELIRYFQGTLAKSDKLMLRSTLLTKLMSHYTGLVHEGQPVSFRRIQC